MGLNRVIQLLTRLKRVAPATVTGAVAIALISSVVAACGPLKGTGRAANPSSSFPSVDALSGQSGDASGSSKESGSKVGDDAVALSLSFESSILPIVKARCMPCHASESATVQEDFQLDTHHAVGSKLGWQGMRSIGESVADSAKTTIESGRMPPAGSPQLLEWVM